MSLGIEKWSPIGVGLWLLGELREIVLRNTASIHSTTKGTTIGVAPRLADSKLAVFQMVADTGMVLFAGGQEMPL